MPLPSAIVTIAVSIALAAPAGAEECVVAVRNLLTEIIRHDLDTAHGPPLNAFLTLNPNAVAQAEKLDRAVAAGAPKGPLFCVPVAVKDNFATYDMPMTAGSLALIGNQPPQDAELVARLRRAGAIIVGKTNMDEFAMGIRGLSGAGGRVGNAYDTRQSAGGSSAGSGAAVGAGLVPFPLGSDNCGSLRIPAVYNGAVTLRASYGRFNSEGVFPIGFINGVPGVIARDTDTLRAALAVVGDGWRTDADETLVAMMGAFESARGPFPRPPQRSGDDTLTQFDVPRQNALHTMIGWRAFLTRRGNDLGALAPERFRLLTQESVRSALQEQARKE
ncbi:MAG: hypothetical protein IT537_17055 [Hyphomicrobiales bacterium]|nr:hypothetical protein [Hyphomicrobiales bacterium]